MDIQGNIRQQDQSMGAKEELELDNRIRELTKQFNEAAKANAEELARIAARKQSALEWIQANRENVAVGYDALLSALVNEDEDLAGKYLDIVRDQLPVIAGIPIDLPDGGATSFKDLATMVFGRLRSPAIILSRAKPGLPPAALKDEAYAAYMKPVETIEADIVESTIITRATGSHERGQVRKINDLTGKIEKQGRDHAAALEAAKSDMDEAVGKPLADLTEVVKSHYNLAEMLDPAENTTAAQFRGRLDSLQEKGILDEILAIGVTAANDDDNFADAVLTAFTTDEIRSSAYVALIRKGCKPAALEKLLEMTFVRQPPFPAEALKVTLEKLRDERGQEHIDNILLSPFGDKNSLLEHVASTPGAPHIETLLALTDPVSALLAAGAKADGETADELLRLCHAAPRSPETFRDALAAIAADGGREALIKETLLAPYAGHSSLIGKAVADGGAESPVAAALLSPLPPLARKPALLQAAAQAGEDSGAGKILTAMAEGLAGTHVPVSETSLFNADNLGLVLYDRAEGALSYTSHGDQPPFPMDAADGTALIDFLGRTPGYLRIDEHTVLNMSQAINLRFERLDGEDGKLHIGLQGEAAPVPMNAGKAELLFERLTEQPGWIRCGGSVFNTAQAENVWVSKTGEDILFNVLASGKVWKEKVGLEQATQAFRACGADKERFISAGNELLNARLLADIYFMPKSRESKQGTIKFKTGRSKNHLASEFSRDEAAAIMKTLVDEHGYFPLGKNEALNPARVQSIYAGQKKLQYIMEGKQDEDGTSMPSETAEEFVRKFGKQNSSFVAEGTNSLVNPAAIDMAWYNGKELLYTLTGEIWKVPMDSGRASQFLGEFSCLPGVIQREDGTLINAGMVGSLRHDGGMHLVLSGKKWNNEGVGAQETARVVQAMVDFGRAARMEETPVQAAAAEPEPAARSRRRRIPPAPQP